MTKRGKKARTKWRKLIAEQARSEQTVTAFCRERSLCRPYFFAWKKRLREDTAVKFLEVQLTEAAPKAAGVSLPKMLSSANTYKISDIQEDEIEAVLTRRAECNNVTLMERR
jgi:hypothetical protein